MELSITCTKNEIMRKAQVYKLLSLMYKEPKAELSVFVSQLQDILRDYDLTLYQISKEMNELFDTGNQDLDEFLVSYSKLFVGPFKLVAPPYSSIYLEDKWEVQSKSSQVVEFFYLRAGLSLGPSWSEPKDHILAQLEFMYYLNYKWNETGNKEFLELQKEFLYKILTHWIPKFNAAIQQGSTSNFYSLLGNLTELFIMRDYESVK